MERTQRAFSCEIAAETKPVPALVMGVDVSALTVIRSLGRRRIPVFALGSNEQDYGAVSRYAKFVQCESLDDESKVISCLIGLSQRVGREMVLFCTADLHVIHVSKNREILKPLFRFVLPEHEVIETLMDKKKLADFARIAGFVVPKTFFSGHRSDLSYIIRTMTFPCVVKPLYHTDSWSRHIQNGRKVVRAESPVELMQKLEDMNVLHEPLIFQEWIQGGDSEVYFCLAYLDSEGKPLALLPGRKLRQYPTLVGNTSLAETIVDDKLVETAIKVLTTAGCKGLCSVEFKKNPSDGLLMMTEPTVGRVDLQEGIAVQAGLDLPFIAYQDATGLPVSFSDNYEVGRKWINEPLEMNYLLSHKNGTLSDLRSYMSIYKGRRSFALFATDDPKPFLRFLSWAGMRGLRYLKKLIPLFGVRSEH